MVDNPIPESGQMVFLNAESKHGARPVPRLLPVDLSEAAISS